MVSRGWKIGVALLGTMVVPGQSCGPFFTEYIFTARTVDVNDLLEGRPQVIQPGSGAARLALVYRLLNGPGLSPEETKAVRPRATADKLPGDDASLSDASAQWDEARKGLEDTATNPLHSSDSPVLGNNWESFSNCLGNGYTTAAATLLERKKEHPGATADLVEWLRGQDAVFSNCDGVGDLPAELAGNSPLWLRQDRAYQTAAAHFYRMEWADAKAGFQSIAEDKDSPWHELADYLVARCLIRQATLSDGSDTDLMGAAQKRLERLANGPGPAAERAQQLLEYVDLRVAPGLAVAWLGERIAKPDTRLQQDLVDLNYAAGRGQLFKDVAGDRKVDLVDWVISMQTWGPVGTEEEHAAERWRQTHSPAWLVAALVHLQSPDEELMKAAAAVAPGSPAWATAAYVRLRLRNKDAATRSELERTRAELAQRHAGILTTNLFSLVARESADSLAEYLRLAPMQPVGVPEAAFISGNSKPTMAGLPVNVGNEKRLDAEAATLLNEQLPLENLAQVVLESDWPKQLRFELAMAVWARAVLLDRPQQARELTPVMIEGEPGWKPWLEAYDAAASQDERRLTGLLGLMRFPSVRPYINAGAGRDEGFAGYSIYRDNWWCAGMAKSESWSYSYRNGYNYSPGGLTTFPAQNIPPSHGFISASLAEAAQHERDQLEKIGDAPQYFGNAALAWVSAHPGDERGAELLGFAFRAMRNGCNLEASVALRHKIFDTLHGMYPQSTWATHYAQFEASSD